MKSATVFRKSGNEKQTNGIIQYGEYSAYSLERGWNNNQHGISCIPAGTYDCQWSFMPSHNKYHYQIMNVPDRDGIFIHSINFAGDLRGCVAIGNDVRDLNGDGEIDLVGSRDAITAFEKYMQDESGKQEDFKLTVVDMPLIT